MSKTLPFFRHDGSLEVTIPSDDVRWTDFLYYSRRLNSEQKGWDYKSHWKNRGLEPLSNAEFLTRWTDASLHNSKAYPRPRPRDFKLGRDFSLERGAAADACKKQGIVNCSENSLNAHLFRNFRISRPASESSCALNPFSGPLLAYEVPLCDDSDGQLKMDLLACDFTARQLDIIELKQAKNTSNSPLMALVEGICYGLQLWRCRNAILKEGKGAGLKLRPDDFKTLNLTIAAPEKYWHYWQCTGEQAKDVVKKMKTILTEVNKAKKLRGAEAVLKLRDFCVIK